MASLLCRRQISRALIGRRSNGQKSTRFALERPWGSLYSFGTSTKRNKDLLAKYRAPAVSHADLEAPRPPPTTNGTFQSASTIPVSSSFQATPKPVGEGPNRIAKDAKGLNQDIGQSMETVPAIKPAVERKSVEMDKPGSKERTVAGVVIPARPQPPGDEGEHFV